MTSKYLLLTIMGALSSTVPANSLAQTRPRPTFVSMGALVDSTSPGGFSSGTTWTGVGAELSVHHYPDLTDDTHHGPNDIALPVWSHHLGIGALAQLETLDARTARASLGGQLSFAFLGAELAGSVQGKDGSFAGFVAIRPAFYVSFGYLGVALRLDVPLAYLGAGMVASISPSLSVVLKMPVNLTEGRAWYDPS